VPEPKNKNKLCNTSNFVGKIKEVVQQVLKMQ
jgi:hypothetical protein